MQTRDTTNRLRFVHFQVNREYVSFPVLGFLNEENDFTQVSKNLSRNIIPSHQDRTREKEDNLKNVIYVTIIYAIIMQSMIFRNYEY